jgi:hypothetical protein
MTIFLTGTIADTADDLDVKRFNKQILECQWIINMAEGRTKPSNHPAYLMYKDHIEWVKKYQECFIAYKDKDYGLYQSISKTAEKIQPSFICEDLYNNFKRRLYTKDPNYYERWAYLGNSYANYYYVDGNWIKYENGKKEIDNTFGKLKNGRQ